MSDHPAARVHMPPVPIETDARVLRREAREAQRRWLADPSKANRETYAAALYRSLLRALYPD